MPWDLTKCTNGVPNPFTNADAVNLVTNADFNQSVFVQTHLTGQTKSAFTYVQFGGMTLCVVGHIHLGPLGPVGPGNSYIPGWMGWSMVTPLAQVGVIGALAANAGVWPDGNRYPH
jgi:hypothetical protein